MWPTDNQTEQLLLGARQGSREAANQLIQRHQAAVQRLIQLRLDRKIQGRVGVSDVLQEVLVEASRRLPAYLDNPQLPFHLWLRQIARDRIIDAHRRHRASEKRSVDRERATAAPRPDQSSILLAAQLCDSELTPAAAAAQRELAQQVESSLTQLSDVDAEIIIMRHYEHLSNQEAAQALQLSEPAASMRYLRAVRRLRELLGGEQP